MNGNWRLRGFIGLDKQEAGEIEVQGKTRFRSYRDEISEILTFSKV